MKIFVVAGFDEVGFFKLSRLLPVVDERLDFSHLPYLIIHFHFQRSPIGSLYLLSRLSSQDQRLFSSQLLRFCPSSIFSKTQSGVVIANETVIHIQGGQFFEKLYSVVD